MGKEEDGCIAVSLWDTPPVSTHPYNAPNPIFRRSACTQSFEIHPLQLNSAHEMRSFGLLLLLLMVVGVPSAPVPFHKNASSLVYILDQTIWKSGAIGGQYFWTVLIYDGREKDQDVRDATYFVWEGVATEVKGYIKVGAVDKNTPFGNKLTQYLGMYKFPQVFGFLAHATNKKKLPSVGYEGKFAVDHIVSWAHGQLPEDFVHGISTESNLTAFLGAPSNASKLDTPKAILFTTNPKKTPPLYLGLSMHFLGRLRLGEVRRGKGAALVERYSIKTLPTLLVLADSEAQPVLYKGPMKWDPLEEFLDAHAVSLQEVAEHKQRLDAEQERRRLNPTERIHTAEAWGEVLAQGGITLVAWLDPQADLVQHKEYLRVLQKPYRRLHEDGAEMRFVWVDGAQQAALAQHFGAAGNMPAVVVMNPQKGWWRFMTGAFNEEHILRHARRQLRKGGGKPLNPEDLPAFAEEVCGSASCAGPSFGNEVCRSLVAVVA